MNHDTAQPHDVLHESDGEAFLAELDAALSGKSVVGPYQAMAAYGAKLSRAVSVESDCDAEEKIREAIVSSFSTATASGTPRLSVVKKPLRKAKATAQRRIGVLDLVTLAAIVALSIGTISIWKNQHKTLPARTVAAEDKSVPTPPPNPNVPPTVPPAGESELDRKLDQRISGDFSGLNFDQAIAKCQALGSVGIVVDPNLKKPADKIGLLNLNEIELRHALTWVCRAFGVEYAVADGKMTVKAPADPRLFTPEIYDLRGQAVPASVVVVLLRDALLQAEFVDQTTTINENNSQLVVVQTPAVHKRLLKILRRIKTRENEPVITFDFPPSESETATLKARLEKTISFDFNNTPLKDALAQTQQMLGLTIVTDPRIQADDTKVQLGVTNMSGEKAISWILKLANLQSELKDGAIYLTPQEVPAPEYRLYNINDLLKKENITDDSLITMMVKVLRPESWAAGQGTHIQGVSGYLLVKQYADVHASIEQVLTQFRHPVPHIKIEPETESRPAEKIQR